jgi:hypothetical protein
MLCDIHYGILVLLFFSDVTKINLSMEIKLMKLQTFKIQTLFKPFKVPMIKVHMIVAREESEVWKIFFSFPFWGRVRLALISYLRGKGRWCFIKISYIYEFGKGKWTV